MLAKLPSELPAAVKPAFMVKRVAPGSGPLVQKVS